MTTMKNSHDDGYSENVIIQNVLQYKDITSGHKKTPDKIS